MLCAGVLLDEIIRREKSMSEIFEKFKKKINQIYDLYQAKALLEWDQQVNMPVGGAEGRGYTLQTVQELWHDFLVSSEMGQMLEDLKPFEKTLDPDSDDARLIKVTRREYDKQVKVTTRWVGEYAMEQTLSQTTWEQAKAENNFKKFLPHLEKIVVLKKEYAEFFKPYDHVYDPLLDDFEPGMKTAEVKTIFNTLRNKQVELIKAIREKPQIENGFLYVDYPEKDQWDFGLEVIKKFGFDFKKGRQDKSVHPFTQGLNVGDVRITTRIDPKYIGTALFGSMHETGHAMYEMGYSPSFARTPLSNGASYAIHESQSRMWENLVGRSLPFWKYFYPKFQAKFPSQVGNVDLNTFYKGINRVSPSLIRVEADEATYNLHIMLRLEIEIELMEGKLQVKDLPEAWNTKVKDYLGLTPPSDDKGVLQDVHWSSGYIGYFPTYALGNLISVQLWEKITTEIPDLERQVETGQFSSLLEWLRSHVHVHGAKFEPQELCRKITGSPIDPNPYIRYLQRKFSEIYGL
jgi:carboxypeptidase Taq